MASVLKRVLLNLWIGRPRNLLKSWKHLNTVGDLVFMHREDNVKGKCVFYLHVQPQVQFYTVSTVKMQIFSRCAWVKYRNILAINSHALNLKSSRLFLNKDKIFPAQVVFFCIMWIFLGWFRSIQLGFDSSALPCSLLLSRYVWVKPLWFVMVSSR